MTHDLAKANFSRTVDRLDAITKPLRNLAWLLALVSAAWVQFLGPGIVTILREASGSNALTDAMQEGFKATSDRLDFIEENIAPPRVVNWNFYRQLGQCSEDDCRMLHNLSRTVYGENCGTPTTTAEIRMGESGQRFGLLFDNGFDDLEADMTGRNFIVPFAIEDYIPDGLHEYRFTSMYPSCGWSREPIPRHSPWFTITVKR